uniref:Glutamic acid-rich protein-like n=1 Tax=Nicotiana tabacum TaxID=4097 RepID=A0A1S3YSL6_TOBAC|nr:PREDICTED: glutamic acid-rich protein-like [Nicotiana tabacum]
MTNPQDNSSTPPPVSPSNTSSSTPPSETPKPRFRRQKMLARKTVASGALRKVLNEKLKAIHRKESPTQESNSSSESEAFIFASESEEHGPSDTDKIREALGEVGSCVVFSTVVENVENMFVLVGPFKDVKGVESSRSEGGNKLGGSGSGEAAEGLVHLSKKQDEPCSSAEETLADLLKRVGASYDPKKCKASTQKAPTASKPTKKSKMSTPKPNVPSVFKGRATRSRVKQREAELQKALEESKKKRKEKGKTKVAESSEVAEEEEEEEEMELVHQERGTTVEVPTPKPKRVKASSKKSSSEPVCADPSLAKRTTSAVKGKQIKITEEEEEWSGEEEEKESEKEQDRFAIFGRRNFLKGRLLRDLDEPGMRRLVDVLTA